jgi:hypothetical protein
LKGGHQPIQIPDHDQFLLVHHDHHDAIIIRRERRGERVSGNGARMPFSSDVRGLTPLVEKSNIYFLKSGIIEVDWDEQGREAGEG